MNDKHKGKRFRKSALLQGREAEGRFAVIVKKRHRARVAPLGDDGTVAGTSFLVATEDLRDERFELENIKRRLESHHAGSAYKKSALIAGYEHLGRYYIVEEGDLESRLIRIGDDGKGSGKSFAIPKKMLADIRETENEICRRVTISDRNVLHVPGAIGDFSNKSVLITRTRNGFSVTVLPD